MDTRGRADSQRRRTHALAPALLAGACVLALSTLCGSALADGKAYFRSEHRGYQPLQQHEQRAAMVHSDGVERLVIAISVNLASDEEALWLFPVPGRPESTKIRLVDSIPKFRGREPFRHARDCIQKLGKALRATQAYPALFAYKEPNLGGPFVGEISVHSQVEQWGLHAETLSATSAADLNAYLEKRGGGLPPEELALFEPYLSEEWTLVAAWLESAEELEAEFGEWRLRWGDVGNRWPCLHVEFPTERMFYPMRVTASYKEYRVDVNLSAAGYVAPVGYARRTVGVQHLRSGAVPEGADPEFARALPAGTFWYTTMWTHAGADWADKDLWLERVPAPHVAYAEFMGNLSSLPFAIPVGIALVAVLSYVAGGLTGLMTFQRWRGYAAFGLWNLLSIVGLILAYSCAPGEWGKKLREGRIGSGFWRIPFPYWVTFSLLFVCLALATERLLLLLLPH